MTANDHMAAGWAVVVVVVVERFMAWKKSAAKAD